MTPSRRSDNNSAVPDSRFSDEYPSEQVSARMAAQVAAVAGPVAMPPEVAARIRTRLHDEIHRRPAPAPEDDAQRPEGRTADPVRGPADHPSGAPRDTSGRGPGNRPPSGPPGRRGGPGGARRTAVPDRRDRLRRACGFAAAAAVVGALAALPVLARPDPGPVRVAADTAEALRRAAPATGPAADPAVDEGWARTCLAAAGAADPAAPLLASRAYRTAGEPGVLLVLATADPGTRRLVVVPADCAPGRARVLAETRTR